MIGTLFKILEHTLGIYRTKDARKYLDRVIELRKIHYAESNKPRPNMAVLDNVDAELRIIVEATTQFGEPDTKTE
jgi:hypothetical protein